MKTAYVILAHGSKQDEARVLLQSLLTQVKKKTNWKTVVPAYLQFCEPGLEDVVVSLHEEGYESVIVMPLFLFPGTHINHDIPRMMQTLRSRYPTMKIELKRCIEDDERIAEIIVDRILKP